MTVHLYIQQGRVEVVVDTVSLDVGDALVLGRGPARDDMRLHVVRGRLTSRHHARVTVTEDGVFLLDLGSSNGTLLEGASIGDGEVAVASGQVAEVGDAMVLFADTELTREQVAAALGPETAETVAVAPVDSAQHVAEAPEAASQTSKSDTSGAAVLAQKSGWLALAKRARVDAPESAIAIYVDGDTDGRVELAATGDAALTIGRGLDADVPLSDPSVSRRHVRVGESITLAGGWVVEDLGSTRGSWLNGRRLVAPTPLEHADVLHFGHYTARILIEAVDGQSRLALTLRRAPGQVTTISGPDHERTLHVVDSKAKRATRAPKWQPTSDLTRPRGWALAIFAALLLIGAGVVAGFWQPSAGITASSSGPGPLSAPHQRAELTCESCHGGSGTLSADSVNNQACQSCHGAHPSQRPGHARLMASGDLGCVDCHQVHTQMEGIDFAADGTWTWWRTGAESVAGGGGGYRPTVRQTVVLVPLDGCFGCHAADNPLDSIQRCYDARSSDPTANAGTPSFCFDEHQSHAQPGVAVSAVSSPQHNINRGSAWEAARHVVAAGERPVSKRQETAPASDATWYWWLAAILLPLALIWIRRRPVVHDPVPEASNVADTSAGNVRIEPVIDPVRCLGCSACIDACPYDVISLEGYVARVVNLDLCCGVGACEEKCPNGSLSLRAVGEKVELVALSPALESSVRPGIFVAGDLTGVPLIKNAINQGTLAMDNVAKGLGDAGDADVDVAIVGAGPAGLAASLRAIALGLSYRTIDQGEIAQSIQNFPRGKLVFDQPLELPVIGDLWLKEASKEELLRHWHRIVRDQDLQIDTYWRLTSVEDTAGAFVVHGVDPRTGDPRPAFTARRVLLCVGRRGSPRKLDLDIPDDAQSTLHYSLADAASLAGRRCLIVGMGDVAMETAVALANQPGTHVSMSYRRAAFRAGSRRNQRAVAELEAAGLIEIHWSSTVSRVERGRVVLQTESDGPSQVDADAVFVMIGGIPPRGLLDAVGVLDG